MSSESEKELLDELRKQTVLLKNSNTANVIGIVALAFLIVAFLATVTFRDRLATKLQTSPPHLDSWRDARTLLDTGDSEGGTEMIRRLIKQHPDYYYGHVLLGSTYLEAGNFEEAEKCYAKAYELYPTEGNEKALAAIRKAIQNKKNSANNTPEDIRR